MAKSRGLRVDNAVRITGAPTRVLTAFVDPRALASWWGVVRAVTAPRPLGVYALEWAHADGFAGGVFHGTVMEFRPGRELFVANAWWLPAGGEPLGPMGLEVTCAVDGPATRVRVRQNGADGGARWKRYQDDVTFGWKASLDALKQYIEDGAAPPPSPGAGRTQSANGTGGPAPRVQPGAPCDVAVTQAANGAGGPAPEPSPRTGPRRG